MGNDSKTPFPNSNVSRISGYKCQPEELTMPSTLTGRAVEPTEDEIQKMIYSLLCVGQLQPIVIREEGKKVIVSAGFTRVTAIARINKEKLILVDDKVVSSPDHQPMPVYCSYSKGNSQHGFVAAIHENHYRNPTKDLDDADNIAMLERWGWSLEKIAATYCENVPWVKGRLSLITLSEDSKAAIRSGKVPMSRAKAIAKLSEDLQRKAVTNGGKIAKEPKAPKPEPVKSAVPTQTEISVELDKYNGSPIITKEQQTFLTAVLKFVNGKTKTIEVED